MPGSDNGSCGAINGAWGATNDAGPTAPWSGFTPRRSKSALRNQRRTGGAKQWRSSRRFWPKVEPFQAEGYESKPIKHRRYLLGRNRILNFNLVLPGRYLYFQLNWARFNSTQIKCNSNALALFLHALHSYGRSTVHFPKMPPSKPSKDVLHSPYTSYGYSPQFFPWASYTLGNP